jgi:hypothetical protein
MLDTRRRADSPNPAVLQFLVYGITRNPREDLRGRLFPRNDRADFHVDRPKEIMQVQTIHVCSRHRAGELAEQ